MPIPVPNKDESHDDFISRCMSDEKMKNEYDQDQRYSICETSFKEKFERNKISFDYDGTISTKKGQEKAIQLSKENTIYIISARSRKLPMLNLATKLNIPSNRIFATGSNKAKIEKIKELNINTHYDNNNDVIKELGSIGKLFK